MKLVLFKVLSGVFFLGCVVSCGGGRRVAPVGDILVGGRYVMLEPGEVRRRVGPGFTPADAGRFWGRPTNRWSYVTPVPHLFRGVPFPVDKIVLYSGYVERVVEGAGVRTRSASETMHVTLLFFHGRLKFAYILHGGPFKRNGWRVLLKDSSPGFVRGKSGTYSFWPGAYCDGRFYDQVILNYKPGLGRHCIWAQADAESRMRKSGYYDKLKKGYERDPRDGL